MRHAPLGSANPDSRSSQTVASVRPPGPSPGRPNFESGSGSAVFLVVSERVVPGGSECEPVAE